MASWIGVGLLVAGASRADVPGRRVPPPSQGPTGPTFLKSTEGIDAAATGRALMGKGDCERAIEAFDASLRTNSDATVRRDRGICHEKVGQPYPAMEDYRAYLFKMPDSPDSDSIRDRLTALEEANKTGETHTEGLLAPDWSNQAGIMNSPGLRGSGSGSVKVAPPKNNAPKDQVEQLEEQEILDNDASRSPLRRGTGFVIGPYFQYRTWGLSSLAIGTGYGVGGSFRQSLGSVSTLQLDLGFASYATNAGQATGAMLGALSLGEQRSGFDMTVAYEARIRFDSRATNQLTIAIGGELTDLVYEQSKDTFFTILARGRLGLRHVFGPSLGLEVAFDVAQPIPGTGSGSAITASAGASTLWQTTVVGGYGGLMLGF
jgi:hypothetical protein